jgi:hypothetical protein
VKYLVYIALIISIVGCFKEDKNLPSSPTQNISLHNDFEHNQFVYLSLDDHIQIKDNADNKWHLRFQNEEKGWNIYLNPLERTTVSKTNITDYYDVDLSFNISGLEWQTDAPTSSGIYPAIGEWGDFSYNTPKSYRNIYILRIKNDISASFYKLQILDSKEDTYRIRYGSLNGQIDNIVSISKESTYKHSFLEIDTIPKQKYVEPPVDKWNLCLTYISDSISRNGELPYIPTINNYYGVYSTFLLNHNFNEVTVDSTHAYNDINFFLARKLHYQKLDQLNNYLISWDREEQKPIINENVTLIMKNEENFYAIKATQIVGNYPFQFDLGFKIKKL